LKNVFEAADTRQKQAKKRSLCIINEHFEPVFNTVAATQIVFQWPVKDTEIWNHIWLCHYFYLPQSKIAALTQSL